MAYLFIRFEIINLKNTVFDVHDISSIRGSSFVGLNAPQELMKFLQTIPNAGAISSKFEGGSQGIYRFSYDGEKNDLEQIIANWWHTASFKLNEESLVSFPLKYLQYTLAILDWSNNKDTQTLLLEHSEAICKWEQFNLPSVIFPERENKNELLEKREQAKEPPYCDVDLLRPVAKQWTFSRPPDQKFLSNYIYYRRNFGSHLRPKQIYESILTTKTTNIPEQLDGKCFSDSFEEIVAQPPTPLPISLNNKIAVVFFDLNGLGTLRRKLNGLEELSTFSQQLNKKRQNLLISILEKLCQLEHPERWLYNSQNNRDSEKIRFETLLWGADENSWVMPAWLAWDFLNTFFAKSETSLTVDNQPVICNYSGGMVICDRRMSIRKARSLAYDLREQAKAGVNGDESSIQIEILESIDIPDNHLDRHREMLFKGSASHDQFTLKGNEWHALTEQITNLRKTLPRSQLNRILHSAFQHQPESNFLNEVLSVIDTQFTSLLTTNTDYITADNAPLNFQDHIIDGPLSGLKGHALIALYNLERFWDYADPFLEFETNEPSEEKRS